MPAMRRVYSSHIDMIGYDPATRELRVVYKTGATAIYRDVPPQVAGDVMNAPSIGTALHAAVRGKFEHDYECGD